jgi:TfoX/Sxy family transcriptional regulator of competence genes
MQYFQLPEDVLEDPEQLRGWSEQAIAVARRKKRPAPRRRDA